MTPLFSAVTLLAALTAPLPTPDSTPDAPLAAAPAAPAAPATPATPAAFALSLDAAVIPANARWLAHVDIQAILGSDLLRALQRLEPEFDFKSNPDLAEMRAMLGFDPFEEVKSLTAYGLPRDEEAAVVMIRTTAVAEGAFKLLELHLQRQAHVYGGIDMWKWSEGHRGDAVFTYMARKPGSDARLLLAAPNAHDLATGVNALRGEIDTLADEPGISTQMASGSLAFLSASGRLAELGHDQDARRIARMVDHVELSIVEHDGAFGMDVQVTAHNPADAMAARQMLQGGLAFLSMAARNEPNAQALLPLVNSLQITTEGSALRVRCSHDIDELVSLLERLERGVHGGDCDDDGSEVSGTRDPKPDKPRTRNKDGWY